ncbi:conserved hypothetical protein [Neospora caninum Liverpool]|uniref:Uncharacterized protein n=1 Tax=Neospora caninum (strain Liverpool) TaxID=572307 RepID=F0V7G9_NEOCL|nr:conserved hypothetical protein [Neospora caninum Liverpool]CBZ49660.1 conserved hypothetical protein [Neospora caninum Liverpool]CEL64244.1 TPA: hypothetical protein BN1204_001480 [Neospora caninum Liverpool]|eukprot:XP_003879695.1 conserved hypothetical protein [Neospora caninum Liverpool]
MKKANSYHPSRRLPPPPQLLGNQTSCSVSPRLSPDFRSLPSSPSASSTYSSVDEEFDLSQKEGKEQSLRYLLPSPRDKSFHGVSGVQSGDLRPLPSPRQHDSAAGGNSKEANGQQILPSTDVDENSAVPAISKDDFSIESRATERYCASKASLSSQRTSTMGLAGHSPPTLLERPFSAAAAAVAAFGLWKTKDSSVDAGEGNDSFASSAEKETRDEQHDEDLVCVHHSGTQAARVGCCNLMAGQGDVPKDPPCDKNVESTDQHFVLEPNGKGCHGVTTCGPQTGFTSDHASPPLLSVEGFSLRETAEHVTLPAQNWMDVGISNPIEATEKMLRPGFAEKSELLDQYAAIAPHLPSGSIRSRAAEEVSLLVEDQWRLLAGSHGWGQSESIAPVLRLTL